MSLIQKTLADHGLHHFEEVEQFFKKEYNLHVRQDKDFPCLYLLMYNQYKTNWDHPLVHQCRGIILEKETNRVVCYPFDKFFNYGEKYATVLGDDIKVQEKLDGSLLKLFYYQEQWLLATNGTINAKTNMFNGTKSFFNLFEEALPTNFNWQILDKNCTYMLELIHPDNIIAIDYKMSAKLFHLGTRNIITFQEIESDDIGLSKPKMFSFSFSSLSEIKESSKNLPKDQEGFVLRDNTFKRLKMKSPFYVELSLLQTEKPESITRFLLKTCLTGETSEVLAYFPQHQQQVAEINAFLNTWATKIEQTYNGLMALVATSLMDQKEKRKQFMLLAKKTVSREIFPLMANLFVHQSTENKNYLEVIKDFYDIKEIEKYYLGQ